MNRGRKGEELKAEEGDMDAALGLEQGEPKLPPEVQQKLGDELRKHYASLVALPLPDRFLELLNELAKSEDEGSGES